ncbi:hypothetical protein SAMN04487943_102421 [Gracilibacillus orientalis]|uniref:Uncharacterized protein n=1 Tax=Gracilibacillus orientalis TaxID=334253 RepID=A0A1I4J1W2_9BACI|nr:hypothetical protein [Gracilibacillus orientalis]SFL60585.1 hypothetical protein SAMN04487943_102421 [Gracilibacillus orientalis]
MNVRISKFINIIGVILVVITGILHWFYYDEIKILFSGLPGLIIIIILMAMVLYKPKNRNSSEESEE